MCFLLCRLFDNEEHAETFLNGELRMMSLYYYRTQVENEHGRKDKYEGTQKLWQGKNTTLKINDQTIEGLLSVSLRMDSYEKKTKICCCTTLCYEGTTINGLDTLSQFNLPYCVIFSESDKFVDRFKNAANGMEYAFGKVSFYNPKIYNGDVNAFMKPELYTWQNEYRLILQADAVDPFFLNVGDLHDIATLFETKVLIKKLSNIGT